MTDPRVFFRPSCFSWSCDRSLTLQGSRVGKLRQDHRRAIETVPSTPPITQAVGTGVRAAASSSTGDLISCCVILQVPMQLRALCCRFAVRRLVGLSFAHSCGLSVPGVHQTCRKRRAVSLGTALGRSTMVQIEREGRGCSVASVSQISSSLTETGCSDAVASVTRPAAPRVPGNITPHHVLLSSRCFSRQPASSLEERERQASHSSLERTCRFTFALLESSAQESEGACCTGRLIRQLFSRVYA